MSKKEKFKDILIRALKTFWQASMSYLIVNIHVIADAITTDIEVGGFETLKSVGLTVGVGAIAAGLSALYNGVIRPLLVKPVEDYSDDEMGFSPVIEEAEEDEIDAEEIVSEEEPTDTDTEE